MERPTARPAFIDWANPPTIEPWIKLLKETNADTAELLAHPPKFFYHGKIHNGMEAFTHLVLQHAAKLSPGFIEETLPGMGAAELEKLLDNPASRNEEILRIIKTHFLETAGDQAMRGKSAMIESLHQNKAINGSEKELAKAIATTDTLNDNELAQAEPFLAAAAQLEALDRETVEKLAAAGKRLADAATTGTPNTQDLRIGLLTSPHMTEDLVLEILENSKNPGTITAITSTAPWAQNRNIQQAALFASRTSGETLETLIRSIAQACQPANLIETLSDIEAAMGMLDKPSLPLVKIFLLELNDQQAAEIPKSTIATLMGHSDKEVRDIAARLAVRLPRKTKPDTGSTREP